MENSEASSGLSARIVSTALECNGVDVIEPIKIGGSEWKNELLFFVKPEVFLLENRSDMHKAMEYILQALKRFEVEINGICAVSGSALEKNEIMSRHYRFINKVSNSASSMLDSETKKKIEEAFNLKQGKYAILGGHEYLKEHGNETPKSLDEEWFREKSVKIRSGLYVRHVKKDGKDVVLVNGFHPKQLSYFTDPSHKIVLMLLHSNTAWSTLKNDMVGATFPEKAVPESMRGEFYRNASNYGMRPITVENNCVHLSAGPYEGMAEIVNFFSKITEMDIKKQQPLMLIKMLSSGIIYDDAVKSLDNPVIAYKDKQTDLFTATEEMDSDDAISVFLEASNAEKPKLD